VEGLHAVGNLLIKYKYRFMFIYMLCNDTYVVIDEYFMCMLYMLHVSAYYYFYNNMLYICRIVIICLYGCVCFSASIFVWHRPVA
jgi:hypothetical protein